jgi:hypothetical protein
VPRMAPWWRGWPHRADGDGGDAPDVMAWPRASAEPASVPLEGSTVLFRRCGAPTVQEWVAQCRGADTGERIFMMPRGGGGE